MNELTTQLNSLQSQIDELRKQINPSTQEVTKEPKFKIGDWVRVIGGENTKENFYQVEETFLKKVKLKGQSDYCQNSDIFLAEQPKPQTKYRRNGSLVFAPETETIWYIDEESDYRVGEMYTEFDGLDSLLSKGLLFDNKEACQLWADKLRIAYRLKQRIVEAESETDRELEYCFVFWNTTTNEKVYTYNNIQAFEKLLVVSTIAKDILMSDDVSVEEFKASIEVFSLCL
jgi:hypothetical protein